MQKQGLHFSVFLFFVILVSCQPERMNNSTNAATIYLKEGFEGADLVLQFENDEQIVKCDGPIKFENSMAPEKDSIVFYKYTIGKKWCQNSVRLVFKDAQSHTSPFELNINMGDKYFFSINKATDDDHNNYISLLDSQKLYQSPLLELANTTWSITISGQTAIVHFSAADIASIIELNGDVISTTNGHYSLEDNKVTITDTNSERVVNLRRTIENLKNSGDKNLTRVYPLSYQSLSNTLFIRVYFPFFEVLSFADNHHMTYVQYVPENSLEDNKTGWIKKDQEYELFGRFFTSHNITGTLFSIDTHTKYMLVDDILYFGFSTSETRVESGLLGSIWAYYNESYNKTGVFVFISNSSYIFLSAQNKKQSIYETGSYTITGNELLLSGKKETNCVIKDNKFTYLDIEYTRL